MPPSSTFRWTLQAAQPGASSALLEGNIDEFAELNGLVKDLSSPQVLLDMAGVKRINSIGVRKWIQLIQALAGPKQVTLMRCSPAVVEQLNCIKEFGGKAQIQSVLLPYS